MTPSFFTAVNCIDGRTQLPLIGWLSRRFGVEHVDLVTEAGVVKILAHDPESIEAYSIYKRIDVSIKAHNSSGIAIVAHHDCAGNPVSEEQQIKQLQDGLDILAARYPVLETLALWIDERWDVHEISQRLPARSDPR